MADSRFFTILFSRMGLPKAYTLQWVVGFFRGLNFTNDHHPQNSWNLPTSKKTNYTVHGNINSHFPQEFNFSLRLTVTGVQTINLSSPALQ